MSLPFIITGTQRSGTMLLSRILGAHPSVFVQNETYLPRFFGNANQQSLRLSEALLKFLEQRASQDAADKAVTFHGLKDPLLSEYPTQLRSLARDCKVIYIVRDPRAVTLSYKENKWGLGVNVFCGALRWRRQNRELLGVRKEFPKNVLMVRYEDLLAESERYATAILEFLEIPFDPAVLDHQNIQPYYPSEPENINAGRALDQSIAERWVYSLSSREKGIVQQVVGELMDYFGYSCDPENSVSPSRVEVALLKMQQKIVGELQLRMRLREKRRSKATKSKSANA